MPVDLLTATAGDLEKQLNSGKTTSVDLVNAYLDQIEGHDDYLHAVISKPPRAFLVEQAKKLDEERQKKMIRSKLHGIPILVKVRFSHLCYQCDAQSTLRTMSQLCQVCRWARLLAALHLLAQSQAETRRLWIEWAIHFSPLEAVGSPPSASCGRCHHYSQSKLISPSPGALMTLYIG